LLAALALVTPATAFGQSAGDEQYEDPFAPETEQSEATPTPAPAPASGGESSAAPAPAPTAEPAPTATAAQQLPYTGADAGILLAGGVALLAGGVALRLRTR
ncbi:MAG TPA: LPXTG cell wall anchor domain-containing protein, partial [Solirubrobacteraceae bacterium]|nr:LPXTG cell wall anchor domain-containing protein [Solirubrobacteraceae bacterium]